MPLFTKAALSLLGMAVSLGGVTLSSYLRPQADPPAATTSTVHHLSGAYTSHKVLSAEAGQVANVDAWAGTQVVKGQVLARLDVPFSTPAVRQQRLALRQSEAAYQQQPTPERAEQLRQARARVAALPHYVRDGYVVAPATGYLASTLVTAGQYVPKAGTVAIIEVPAAK